LHKLKKKKSSPKLVKPQVKEITIENLIKESNISKIVSESITKKVIILVLTMLILMPIISEDFYTESSDFYHLIANFISSGKAFNKSKTFSNNMKDIYTGSNSVPEYPVINITLGDNLFYLNETLRDYTFRSTEVKYQISDSADVVVT
jgi:hypothetical protein